MPDTQPDTTDIDIPAPMIERPGSTALIISAEQYQATWSMSKALAASQSFKDIGRDDAPKALARIMLGADLGMSPTQALMGIDIVKGNPQIRGVALGRMVRQSAKRPTPSGESYDYAVLDRGFEPDKEYAVVALYRRDDDGQWPWIEGEPVTFPTIVGPVTINTGERLPEAVEGFKLDQARKRNLIKLDGAWSTQPEVMVVWRALSQLVRFYAPDVIGGMSVYTEADSFGPAPIGAGQGSGEGPGWGDMPVETVRAVMNVIERARELKHAGLSDLPTIQQRLNGQPAEVVAQWVEDSTGVLDGMAEPEPPDAEVVEDEPAPADASSLTFGGQTFVFDAAKYPETFRMISDALDGDAHDCARTALQLLEFAENVDDDDNLVDRYRLMAEAMHAEAESRRGVNEGQTEIEF